MKLTFWKIPGLVTHQGFAILDVVERPGLLEAHLQNSEDETLKLKIVFRNHTGFMACDEFGMERYVIDSPARQGLGGANFFIAAESEFKVLLQHGRVDDKSSMGLVSFVLVDSDHWIEIVTANEPEFDIMASADSMRH
jgi:hypothetical protein